MEKTLSDAELTAALHEQMDKLITIGPMELTDEDAKQYSKFMKPIAERARELVMADPALTAKARRTAGVLLAALALQSTGHTPSTQTN